MLARPTLVELRAAARALGEGRFRSPDAVGVRGPLWTPEPGERTVVVLGSAPGVGATTVAVAIAAARGAGRVVECCSASRSGLVAASFTELGEADAGWLRGQRDTVFLERRGANLDDVAELPPPLPAGGLRLTIVDAGADLDAIRRAGWLADLLVGVPLVVVATGTLPGLRRLETRLADLDADADATVAVVGPPRRRWPKALSYGLGPKSRALDAAGRLVAVPLDRRLALHGLDSAALPPRVLAAGALLADLAVPSSI
jgi:hypothetical protein